MASQSLIPTDLSKLTVPQLKALCKEKRLTGYSKLAKNVLIQKLTESRVSESVLSSENSAINANVVIPQRNASAVGEPSSTGSGNTVLDGHHGTLQLPPADVSVYNGSGNISEAGLLNPPSVPSVGMKSKIRHGSDAMISVNESRTVLPTQIIPSEHHEQSNENNEQGNRDFDSGSLVTAATDKMVLSVLDPSGGSIRRNCASTLEIMRTAAMPGASAAQNSQLVRISEIPESSNMKHHNDTMNPVLTTLMSTGTKRRKSPEPSSAGGMQPISKKTKRTAGANAEIDEVAKKLGQVKDKVKVSEPKPKPKPKQKQKQKGEAAKSTATAVLADIATTSPLSLFKDASCGLVAHPVGIVIAPVALTNACSHPGSMLQNGSTVASPDVQGDTTTVSESLTISLSSAAHTANNSSGGTAAESMSHKRPGSSLSILHPESKKAKLPTVTAKPSIQRAAVLTPTSNLFKIPLVLDSKPSFDGYVPPTVFASEPIVGTRKVPQTIDLVLESKTPTMKRFKPLVVSKPIADTEPMVKLAHISPHAHQGNISAPYTRETQRARSTIDDLFVSGVSSSASFDPISLPPSLSQRKRVHRWAIVLSGLSNEERRQCVLVSRMFRYAVYLSAGHILHRNFSGRRLTKVLEKHLKAMTNFWPYLKQRELEVSVRKKAFFKSFLARFFKDFNPISEQLWTSPDDENQVAIAMRFVMTRLWFAMSIGNAKNDSSWLQDVILSCREVVKDEIWNVTVQSTSSDGAQDRPLKTFHVLVSTCEVVGRPVQGSSLSTASDTNKLSNVTDIPVRADWSAYIANRLLSPPSNRSIPQSISSCLKWANYEEYDRGISRLWLKRIAEEGESGNAKRIVAERCSVSGQWMTSTQMAQEFAGLPSQVPTMVSKQREPQINLFLPAHHHVESAHFSASGGRPLHIALAVVQTPGREYYILRDNGMQVGCEEDGVGEVWMELLGCDASGVDLSVG